MDIINDVKEKVSNWLFSIALKKGITRVAIWLASWLISHHIAFSFQIDGTSVDNTEQGLTGGLILIFEMLRNYLKQKFPNKFGWL